MNHPDQTVDPGKRSSPHVVCPPNHIERSALDTIPASSPVTSITGGRVGSERSFNSGVVTLLVGTVCVMSLHLAELDQHSMHAPIGACGLALDPHADDRSGAGHVAASNIILQ